MLCDLATREVGVCRRTRSRVTLGFELQPTFPGVLLFVSPIVRGLFYNST